MRGPAASPDTAKTMTRIRGGTRRLQCLPLSLSCLLLLCLSLLLCGVTTTAAWTPPIGARRGARASYPLGADRNGDNGSSRSFSAENADGKSSRSSSAQLVAPPVAEGSSEASTTTAAATTTTTTTATTTTGTPSARFLATAVPGPSLASKPAYETMVGPLGRRMDRLFCSVFRHQLAAQVGGADSKLAADDYQGIIELAARMNREISGREEIQQRAQTVLRNLFPSWMPGSYAVLFSKPFPAFSSRMNAWATRVAGTWLMGDCEINTVPVDGNALGVDQGLLVKRCRFLEESGCASVCVNSCKIPTQRFFAEEMGLPLLMEPDYETYECQFSFGRTPTLETEGLAQATPCLQRCPTAGSLRAFHLDSDSATSRISPDAATPSSACPFMEEAV